MLFVGYNMQAGGIQRSLINTLHLLKEKTDLEIELFLFSNTGELSKEIPADVHVIKSTYLLALLATPFSEVLKKGRVIDKITRLFLIMLVRVIGSVNLFNILFSMNKNLTTYDVAISYFNDVPGGYFNRGSNQYVCRHIKATKKIGWIHTDPIKARFDRDECLKTYADFNTIVNVSKAGKEKFDGFIPEYINKSIVVYNCFPVNDIRKKVDDYGASSQLERVNFITVARIDNDSKRIDRIVRVAHLLKENGYTNFNWKVIGDGPDLKENLRMAEQLGLMNYIEFLGEKSNPYPFIKKADAFILASDYEGFPMVVGESLTLKTPVITTAYAAAAEQIRDGIDGMIVDRNGASLYEALKLVVQDKNILRNLRKGINDHPVTNDLSLQQLKDLLE